MKRILQQIWAGIVWLGAAILTVIILYIAVQVMMTMNMGPNCGLAC